MKPIMKKLDPYKLIAAATGEVIYLNIPLDLHALIARISGTENYRLDHICTRYGKAVYRLHEIETWESREPNFQDYPDGKGGTRRWTKR